MYRTHRFSTALMALSVLSFCTGCPFRKEKIVIGLDGSVAMDLEYSGSPAELERFDALPSGETGWTTRRTTEIQTKADGQERETVTVFARQTFKAGEPLPRRLVPNDDPMADLVLDFPTNVRFEDRSDGRYVYFQRTYTPRRWAYVNYWDGVFIDDEIKRLSEKDVDALSRDERMQIISALTSVEAFREIEYGREAMRSAFPDAPPEHFLLARQALLDTYENNVEDREAVMDGCSPLAEAQRNECFEVASKRWLEDGRSAFANALREKAGYDRREMGLFGQALETARRYHEITRELGGHAFRIEVTVPGKIVGHNGDKVEQEVGSGTVTFEFDGRAFQDRQHELVVVARIAGEE